MIYAYCRNTNINSTETSISFLQKWEKDNNLVIDEIVLDEDVKQKAPFETRRLGTYLLPKIKDGDIIVATEVSCLGRSAIEIDRLFNTVLSTKKIRVICLSLDIDVNYGAMSLKSASDLRNISFAAKLYRQLVHETTKAALANKKNKGVKMGGANAIYKKNLAKKSEKEIKLIHEKKGHTKSLNYYKSKDIQTFLEICRKIFGVGICDGNPIMWDWGAINTKHGNGDLFLRMMQDYKKKDSSLFLKWDFSNTQRNLVRVSSQIQSVRRTLDNLKDWDEFINMLREDYQSKKEEKRRKKKPEQEMLETIQIDIGGHVPPDFISENGMESPSNVESNISKNKVSTILHEDDASIKISEESISKFKKKNENKSL